MPHKQQVDYYCLYLEKSRLKPHAELERWLYNWALFVRFEKDMAIFHMHPFKMEEAKDQLARLSIIYSFSQVLKSGSY